MTCEHVSRSDLELFVSGLLDDVRCAALVRHVAGCGCCEQALAREARIEVAIGEAACALEPRRRRGERVTRPRSLRYLGGIGGALALAAVAVLWVVPRGRTQSAEALEPPSLNTALSSSLSTGDAAGRVTDVSIE